MLPRHPSAPSRGGASGPSRVARRAWPRERQVTGHTGNEQPIADSTRKHAPPCPRPTRRCPKNNSQASTSTDTRERRERISAQTPTLRNLVAPPYLRRHARAAVRPPSRPQPEADTGKRITARASSRAPTTRLANRSQETAASASSRRRGCQTPAHT